MARMVQEFQIARGINRLQMPSGAHPLSVRSDRGVAKLAALVDTDRPLSERYIGVVGTGQDLPNGVQQVYVGTFTVDAEVEVGIVYHAFDLGRVV